MAGHGCRAAPYTVELLARADHRTAARGHLLIVRTGLGRVPVSGLRLGPVGGSVMVENTSQGNQGSPGSNPVTSADASRIQSAGGCNPGGPTGMSGWGPQAQSNAVGVRQGKGGTKSVPVTPMCTQSRRRARNG